MSKTDQIASAVDIVVKQVINTPILDEFSYGTYIMDPMNDTQTIDIPVLATGNKGWHVNLINAPSDSSYTGQYKISFPATSAIGDIILPRFSMMTVYWNGDSYNVSVHYGDMEYILSWLKTSDLPQYILSYIQDSATFSRGITWGTTELEAGVSKLATGHIYLQYE